MVHFLDAVIKPVKFFGVFFSQKKQTNRKKYSQKTRGAKDLSKDYDRSWSVVNTISRWHGDGTNCHQQT